MVYPFHFRGHYVDGIDPITLRAFNDNIEPQIRAAIEALRAGDRWLLTPLPSSPTLPIPTQPIRGGDELRIPTLPAHAEGALGTPDARNVINIGENEPLLGSATTARNEAHEEARWRLAFRRALPRFQRALTSPAANAINFTAISEVASAVLSTMDQVDERDIPLIVNSIITTFYGFCAGGLIIDRLTRSQIPTWLGNFTSAAHTFCLAFNFSFDSINRWIGLAFAQGEDFPNSGLYALIAILAVCSALYTYIAHKYGERAGQQSRVMRAFKALTASFIYASLIFTAENTFMQTRQFVRGSERRAVTDTPTPYGVVGNHSAPMDSTIPAYERYNVFIPVIIQAVLAIVAYFVRSFESAARYLVPVNSIMGQVNLLFESINNPARRIADLALSSLNLLFAFIAIFLNKHLTLFTHHSTYRATPRGAIMSPV